MLSVCVLRRVHLAQERWPSLQLVIRARRAVADARWRRARALLAAPVRLLLSCPDAIARATTHTSLMSHLHLSAYTIDNKWVVSLRLIISVG